MRAQLVVLKSAVSGMTVGFQVSWLRTTSRAMILLTFGGFRHSSQMARAR